MKDPSQRFFPESPKQCNGKAETNMERRQYFLEIKNQAHAHPSHVHLPLRMRNMDLVCQSGKCYRKIMNISYKDHVTNERVRLLVHAAVGKRPRDDLLIIVKQIKLRWYSCLAPQGSPRQSSRAL